MIIFQPVEILTLLRVLLEPMPVITLPMHTIMDQVALFIPVVVVDNII